MECISTSKKASICLLTTDLHTQLPTGETPVVGRQTIKGKGFQDKEALKIRESYLLTKRGHIWSCLIFPYFHGTVIDSDRALCILYVILLYTQCNNALLERGTKKKKYSSNLIVQKPL